MSKRMKLVPEDYSSKLHITAPLVEKLTHKIPKPDEDLFSRKDRGASNLLAASTIPDDIKLQLYGSLMNLVNNHLTDIINKPLNVKVIDDQEVKHVSEVKSVPQVKHEVKIAPEVKEKPVMVEKAVSSKSTTQPVHMPRALLEKQSYIMNKLMDHPHMISWDDDGRVTFFGNNFSPNSDIRALLHSVTSDAREVIYPHGYSSFENVLKMTNIPPHVVSKRLHTMLSSPKPAVSEMIHTPASPTKPSDEFSTPTQSLTFSSWREVAGTPKVGQKSKANITPAVGNQSKTVTPATKTFLRKSTSSSVTPPLPPPLPPLPGKQRTPADFLKNVATKRGTKQSGLAKPK